MHFGTHVRHEGVTPRATTGPPVHQCYVLCTITGTTSYKTTSDIKDKSIQGTSHTSHHSLSLIAGAGRWFVCRVVGV